MVWEHGCRSWYKNNSISGKVTALWPGSTLHYLEAIADSRYDDFDFQYSGNRYAFLGSRFSQVETDRTADWAYYIRNKDDGPHFNRSTRLKVIYKWGTTARAEVNGTAA